MLDFLVAEKNLLGLRFGLKETEANAWKRLSDVRHSFCCFLGRYHIENKNYY